MDTVMIRGARVLTLGEQPWPRRGHAVGDLSVLDRGDVLVRDVRIAAVGVDLAVPAGCEVIEAEGRVLMPGLVDCHTHLCWAGSRIDEWERRLGGMSYLDIMALGGGIMSTVRAVRAASREALSAGLLERLGRVLRAGTTTVEIKSGYGLSATDELKMLGAVADAASGPARSCRPPCSAMPSTRTFPGLWSRRSSRRCRRSPGIPGITVDAYCEKGAWSVEETILLFERARELGHPLRVHADQFNSLGMVPAAIRLGAVSADHLEASTEQDLHALASSATFGVLLPCCGFHVDGRFADGRRFLNAGGLVAIASNANPGSAPCGSMPMAIALAVRACGLSPTEAIGAATANAAALHAARPGHHPAGQAGGHGASLPPR